MSEVWNKVYKGKPRGGIGTY